MPAPELNERLRACVARYVGRAWREGDGTTESRVAACEHRLGITLPPSLRATYLELGELAYLLEAHNRVLRLEDIEVQDGYLVFMEENQEVVSWGIPVTSLHENDPVVWQRNNMPPVAWYSEEKGVADLLVSMWDWYCEVGLLFRAC